MRNIRIYSTNASEGAVELSNRIRELGVKSTKVPFASKTFVPNGSDLFLNWGSSSYPKWLLKARELESRLLNYPEYVSQAINKITTFNILREIGVSIPEYATELSQIPNNWKLVVCRDTVSGSGGIGIKLYGKIDIDKNYPLYVQYIKKSKEYRVHVFNGAVIDIQEKRKRTDFEGTINNNIRNLHNGWVFCRDNVEPTTEVLEEAVAAVEALNLDFGAVDVIWNKHYNKAYVLEVNTAPGLEGSTIEAYAHAILNYVNNLDSGE